MNNFVKDILNVENNEIQLSERATEIDIKTQQKECREIVTSLKKTIEHNNMTALAATEIGYERRIFCVKFDIEIKTFINPMMVGGEGIQLVQEQSNVTGNKVYIRPRLSKVNLMYQRPTGQVESKQFLGKAALYIQQMMDAIDGIIESDIGLEIDDDFNNAAEAEKNEILSMYLDSLDLKTKQLEKEIEEDEQLSQTKKAIDYMTSVIKGETKIEPIIENE